MASASAGKRPVFISFSEDGEEVKEMLENDLKAENIEIATSKTIPYSAGESDQQWAQRKCKNVAAVLVIMSNDYQEDEECRADAEAAILNSKIYFAKAKTFEENEWTKKIKGTTKVFDLSNTDKYLRNSPKLIDSLKQVLSNQGIARIRVSNDIAYRCSI